MTKKSVQFKKRGYEVQIHPHEFVAERLERPQTHASTPTIGGKLESMLQEMVIEHGGEPIVKKDKTSMDIERKLTEQTETFEKDSIIARKLNNFRRKSVQLSHNIMQRIRRGSTSGRKSSSSSDRRVSISSGK